MEIVVYLLTFLYSRIIRSYHRHIHSCSHSRPSISDLHCTPYTRSQRSTTRLSRRRAIFYKMVIDMTLPWTIVSLSISVQRGHLLSAYRWFAVYQLCVQDGTKHGLGCLRKTVKPNICKYQLLYTNIKIGGIDCRVITTEYRIRVHCIHM